MRTSRMVLVVALATAYAVAIDASAREGRGGSYSGHGGGKPGAAYPGAKPGSGGHGHGWQGGRHYGHRGDHHYGHRGGHYRWRGYYGGYPGYYYPAWGLGVGLGVTWPWWGWGYESYPYPYWRSHSYPYPVGVVVERSDPSYVVPDTDTPAFRWYCPPVASYHPDVIECAQPWLKVLPQDAGPSAPPRPNAPMAPPAPVPRSSSPPGEDVDAPLSALGPDRWRVAPIHPRIAAPRIAPPSRIAKALPSEQVLASKETP